MTEEPKQETEFRYGDPGRLWSIDAKLLQSAVTVATSVIPLPELRFCGGVLQQAWQITEYSGGAPSTTWKQWRPVPSVPAEAQAPSEEESDG